MFYQSASLIVCHQSVRGDENLKVLFIRIASIVPGFLEQDQTGYEAGGHIESIVLCDQWSLGLIRALKVIGFVERLQRGSQMLGFALGCRCKAHMKHVLLLYTWLPNIFTRLRANIRNHIMHTVVIKTQTLEVKCFLFKTKNRRTIWFHVL